MYCRECGALNLDEAVTCQRCGKGLSSPPAVGPPPLPGSAAPYVPNYLVYAILVTLFCCLPLGIPAIIFSAQVNSKIQAGDIEGAMASSQKAKKWGWTAFGVGIVFTLLYVIISMLSAVGA